MKREEKVPRKKTKSNEKKKAYLKRKVVEEIVWA
jgi:hypothetical protein